MNKLLMTCLLCASCSLSFAQSAGERSIRLLGKVADSFTQMPISNAKVTLMTKDSIAIDTFRVMVFDHDALYSFLVPAKRSNYILKVEQEKYETAYMPYELHNVGRNIRMDVPSILLKKKAIQLKEVVVKATKVKMFYRGDTIVFNADAFQVAEGSMLDDLIRQMPGVELNKSGEIFVNGKKVDYLMLNGKDFYRGNNKLMLENLPYYMVHDVQVYNRTTDRALYSGLTKEKKDYVMDVQLKRQYRQGYIANTEAGGGTEDAYYGRLFGLRFTDHSRLTLIGNLNNLNTEYKPHDDGNWDESGDLGREGRIVRKRLSGGLDIDTRRWKNNIEGSIGWDNTHTEEKGYTETVVSDSSVHSDMRSQNDSHSFTAMVNNNFTLKVPFYLQSSTSMDYRHNDDAASADYASASARQTTVNGSHGHDLSLSQSLASTHQLAWGDVLDLSASLNYTDATQHSDEQRSTEEASTENFRHYNVDTEKHSYNYRFGMVYTMNNFHHGTYKLQLTYRQRQQTENADRFNMVTHLSDRDNSYHLNQLQRSFLGTLSYRYEYEKDENHYTLFQVEMPFRLERQRSYYQKSWLDTCAVQRHLFVEPRIEIERGWNRRNINASVGYTQDMVSVTSLIHLPDTLDPLRTYIGNPDLKPSGVLNLSAFYSDNAHQWRQVLVKMGWTSYFNNITQSYAYNAATGHYTYQPRNINGNWRGSGALRYTIRIAEHSPVWIGAETSLTISHTKDYSGIEDEAEYKLRKMNFYNGEETFNIVYDRNKTRLDLRGSIELFRSTSDASNFENVNACHYRYGMNATTELPLHISFTSSLFIEHRRGYSTASLNTNECQWNMTVGRTFCKGKRLLVRLTAIDLLHSYSSVSYHVSGSGRTETWQYSLPAYWLLRVGYKFNLNPKNK